MSEDQWEEFRPRWAPHVKGEHTARVVDERGVPEPQRWKCTCEVCGAIHGPVVCDSGMVRKHISNFAIAHAHRDPLNDPFPKAR